MGTTRKLATLILTMAMIFLLIACSNNQSPVAETGNVNESVDESKQEKKSATLFFYKFDDEEGMVGSLYVQKGNKEMEKLASNVQVNSHVTDKSGENLLILDENYDLYFLAQGKEKEKIASDISYSFGFTNDGKSIYYLSDNGELYFKEAEKEKIKVASDVNFFETTTDKGPIYIHTYEGDLYRMKLDEEKERIAFDVSYFSLVDEKTVLYISNDDLLYYVDEKDERIKISSNETSFPIETTKAKKIVFFEDYNYERGYGELYISDFKGQKERIASDVSRFYLTGDGKYVLYLNDEQKLIRFDIAKNEKLNISENVYDFVYSNDGESVLYETEENDLFLQKVGQEAEKITSKPQYYLLLDGVAYYINDESQFYSQSLGKEKVKLVDEIKDFHYDGNFIYYLTKEHQVGYLTSKEESQVLVEAARNYDAIYVGDYLLFNDMALVDDIVGFWHAVNEYGEDMVIHFSKKGKEQLQFSYATDYFDESLGIEVYSAAKDVLYATSDEDDDLTIRILDRSTITLEDSYEEVTLYLSKITQSEYEAIKQQFQSE